MRNVIAALCLCLSIAPNVRAESYSNVGINGQVLTLQQLAQLEQQIGTRIVPGNYLVDWTNGCWANLSTGASGCLNGSGEVPAGSGDGARGDWYYHSGPAGGAVGGTADGCVYTTFGWSNC